MSFAKIVKNKLTYLNLMIFLQIKYMEGDFSANICILLKLVYLTKMFYYYYSVPEILQEASINQSTIVKENISSLTRRYFKQNFLVYLCSTNSTVYSRMLKGK